MDKKEILDILDNAKDERGDVPMRLVRQAFDKLAQPEESTETHAESHACDLISRNAAIEYFMINTNWHDEEGHTIDDWDEKRKLLEDYFNGVPSAQQEYEPVTAEDFAKTMSETSVYSYMLWHSEALTLMERQGFVICKKTM